MPTSGKLPEPRKKKRIHQQESSPFPVPIASIDDRPSTENNWYYYTGQLFGNCVMITRPSDITFLYKMGFFGKGMLSRSKPEHKRFVSSYQGLVRKRLPPKERRFQQQRFQQVRKQRYMRHLQWFNQLQKQEEALSESKENPDNKCDDSCVEPVCDESQRTDNVSNIGNACTSMEGQPDSKRAKCDDITKNNQPWNTQSDDDIPEGKDVTLGTTHAINRSEDVNSEKIVSCQDNHSPAKGLCVQSELTLQNTDAKMDTNSQETFSRQECTENDDIRKEKTKVDDEGSSSENTDVVIADSDESNNDDVGMVICDKKEVKEKEVQETKKLASKHGKKKTLKKKDPYPIQEYLELSLEEAYFLAFGLGCLTVNDEDGNPLSLRSMWQKFCSIQHNFVSMYVVYHNMRSKGWVPKTGIKFGSDFIVYKQGPPFYHSTYSVLVSMVDGTTLLPCRQEERPLSWHVVSGMNRVTEHAAKALLFCYVLKPSDMADQEMLSPQCLSRFKVQEILMQRWIPSRERQDKRVFPMIS